MKKSYAFLILTALLSFNSCNENSSSSVGDSSVVDSSSSVEDSSVVDSSSSEVISTIDLSSLQIAYNEQEVETLDLLVGDEINLSYVSNDNLTPLVQWDSSNDAIATIDENGKVNVVGSGKVIITLTATEYPYINDSIYLNCTRKVYQTGVGSGKSPSDPIYLGNEGEDEPLEVYFIEMQQIYGDSLYIKKGGVDILIDSGYAYDGTFVKDFVNEHLTDGILDLLILTHSDGDHIDGLKDAVSPIDSISLMVDYGGTASGKVKETREFVIDSGNQYHSAYDCVNGLNGALDRYYLTSEFYFDVLNTGNYVLPSKTSAGNGASVSVIFYYKDFSFFTAGDLTSSSEATLLKNEDLPEVTLYKASHHGSNGSNSQELLDTLNPKGVGISCAVAGSYGTTPSPTSTTNLSGVSGHPYQGALERIYKAPNISQNLNVYWSGVNGTMKFTTYGTDSFTFEGSPTKKGYYDLTLTNGTPVWDEELGRYKNKVTGEENFKFHETKVFKFRNYISILPKWAQEQYFPS